MGIRNKVFIPLVLLIFFAVSICMLSAADLSKVGKQTTEKIGFADSLAIYHSYFRTKEEDERRKEKGNELQAKLDIEKGKIAELEKKMNSGILSEEEKGKLNKEMEDTKTQLSKKIQEFNLEIEGDRRKTIDRLRVELKEKISTFGKEKGYIMILDQNQLIFSDTSLDLTKEIVDYTNKDAPVRTDIKKEAGGSK